MSKNCFGIFHPLKIYMYIRMYGKKLMGHCCPWYLPSFVRFKFLDPIYGKITYCHKLDIKILIIEFSLF